jgi:alpha-L-arabinofuranosidase
MMFDLFKYNKRWLKIARNAIATHMLIKERSEDMVLKPVLSVVTMVTSAEPSRDYIILQTYTKSMGLRRRKNNSKIKLKN